MISTKIVEETRKSPEAPKVRPVPCLLFLTKSAAKCRLSLLHRRIEPLRQRAGLQANARHFKSKIPEPANQVVRLAQDFRLPQDLAARVHDANTGGFQRKVNSGIVVH